MSRARSMSRCRASGSSGGSTNAGTPAHPCGDPASHDNPRDAVLACASQAAIAVARGDESAAGRAYSCCLARWPLRVRFAERHLRRFLALGYVLSDPLRAHWDGVELGPSHQAARAAARALRQAREGDLTAARKLPPAHALCFLPLPWSVELAARLAAAGHPEGRTLGGWLTPSAQPSTGGSVNHPGKSARPWPRERRDCRLSCPHHRRTEPVSTSWERCG